MRSFTDLAPGDVAPYISPGIVKQKSMIKTCTTINASIYKSKPAINASIYRSKPASINAAISCSF